MTFDWSGFEALARRLSEEAASEASLRTAVSRFYYACLHRCRLSLSFDPDPGRDTHEQIIGHFDRPSAPGHSRQIGNWMRKLKRLRLKADYDDEPPVSPALAQQAKELSARIGAALESPQAGT